MGRPFGQHFLRAPHIVEAILAAADIQSTHRVLEIGPGQGVLTEPLARAAKEVLAVEVDPAMAAPLQGRWPNAKIILHDVMELDLAAHGPFDRIVANLPYQISGPVTAKLLDLHRTQGWGRAVLMYQREFGQRLLAGPGTKAYGRLSVQVAQLCETSKVRDVPAGCFDPPPKVDSVVLRFDPRDEPLFDVDAERFRRVLEQAFGQRRKQLHNSLAGLVDRAHLDALGVADARPEQVSPEMFGRITEG